MAENLKKVDWILLLSILPLFAAGLITMKTFGASEQIGGDYFFWRQLIWAALGLGAFFILSFSDLRWLRRGLPLLVIYFLVAGMLVFLLIFGEATRGSVRFLTIGGFSFGPSEFAKVALILLLAKYFSRRHIEIANIKHIIISGVYALFPATLVFLQPDLGSASILVILWFGMILASGISKKHLFTLILTALSAAVILWFFLMAPYQKARVYSFLNPYLDPRGAGYHAIQAKIAVGAGGLLGRGIGFGSQSRFEFLPEHQTDFIFAAFAEEWGLVGSLMFLAFFALIIWRIAKIGSELPDNFGRLYAVGLGTLFVSQFFIHVGMNVGLLPITGLSLPFVSYGGSSMITFFAALGILVSLKIKSSFLGRETS